jgi:hypothetical protein
MNGRSTSPVMSIFSQVMVIEMMRHSSVLGILKKGEEILNIRDELFSAIL